MCQESIRKFDEMILDMRKHGFSLVTVLLNASGFLYGAASVSEEIALGVFRARYFSLHFHLQWHKTGVNFRRKTLNVLQIYLFSS
jgi:hypothetical protein